MELNESFLIKLKRKKDLFLDEFYEKKPFYIKNEDNAISLISSYIELISKNKLHHDDIRLVSNGENLDSSLYTKINYSIPYLVYEYFKNGYTIAVHDMEKHIPCLIEICQFLDDFLHPNKTQINSYFSPKSSTGLTPHFDVHDVFIYQAHGEKRWQVWDGFLDLPNNKKYLKKIKTKTLDFIKEKETLLDVVLKEGDILYIPRGFIHKPFTISSHSLHLTIGILPRDIFSIISLSLKNLKIDEEKNIKKYILDNCEKYINESIKERV